MYAYLNFYRICCCDVFKRPMRPVAWHYKFKNKVNKIYTTARIALPLLLLFVVVVVYFAYQ